MSVTAAKTQQTTTAERTRQKFANWLRTGLEEARLTLLPFTAERILREQEERRHTILVVPPHIRAERPAKNKRDIAMRNTGIKLRVNEDHWQEIRYSMADFVKETHYKEQRNKRKNFLEWAQKKALYGAKGTFYFTIGNTVLMTAMNGVKDTLGSRAFLVLVGGTLALYWAYYAASLMLAKIRKYEERRKVRLFREWVAKKRLEIEIERRTNPGYN